MENLLNEEMVEETVVPSTEANRKSSKGLILGVVTIAAVVLFKFRKKIGTRIENSMVKKLGKKGYSVISPAELNDLTDDID